jgi:predicted ATPase
LEGSRLPGRKKELDQLSTWVRDAANGKGRVLLVTGLPGAGKSAFAAEAVRLARERRGTVVQVRCRATPGPALKPLVDAVASAGLPGAAEPEEAPLLEGIFLMHPDGRTISSASRGAQGGDADVLSSMLLAVSSFVSDSMEALRSERDRQTGPMSGPMVLRRGPRGFALFDGGMAMVAAVFSGGESELMFSDLRALLRTIEETCADEVDMWDGVPDSTPRSRAALMELISSPRWEGEAGAAHDAKVRRDRRIETMSLALERAARSQLMLVVAEDLEHADETMVTALSHLARSLAPQRALVIVTLATDEDGAVPSALRRRVETLRQETRVQEVPLGPLDAMGVRDLVAQRYPVLRDAEALVPGFLKASAGLPLTLSELLRLLVQKGSLVSEGGAWALKDREILDILDGRLGTIARARLRLLPEKVRAVLQAVAVAEEGMDVDTVAKASGAVRVAAVRALSELDRLQGLLATEGDRYVFRHEAVRHAVYDSLDEEQARRAHEAQASRVEETRGPMETMVHHRLAAGRIDLCRDALKTLVEEHKGWYALDTALHFALQLMESTPDGPERLAMLETVAELQAETGDIEGARHAYEGAMSGLPPGPENARLCRKVCALLERSGGYEAALRLAVGTLEEAKGVEHLEIARLKLERGWILLQTGNYDAARKAATEALVDLELSEAPDADFAALQGIMANIHLAAGDAEKAYEAFRRAAAPFDAGSRDPRLATMMVGLGDTLTLRGDHPAALGLYTRCLQILQRHGDQRAVARLCHSLGRTHMTIGNWQKAASYFHRGVDIARRQGDARDEMSNLTGLAEMYLGRKELEQAAIRCREAIEVGSRGAPKAQEADALRVLGDIRRIQRQWGEAIDSLTKAVAIYEESGADAKLARALVELSSMYRDRDDTAVPLSSRLDRALYYIRKARSLAEKRGDPKGEVEVALQESDLHARRGDPVAAGHTAAAALKQAFQVGSPDLSAEALSQVARLSRDDGHFDEAISALKVAVKMLLEAHREERALAVLDNLAEVCRAAGQEEMAAEATQRATALRAGQAERKAEEAAARASAGAGTRR